VTVHLSPLWRELLVQLHGAVFLRTDQIVRLLGYLAAVHGLPVAQKARVRVAQSKLKHLTEAGIVRRVPLPVLPGTGSAYTVYTLDPKAGLALVADHLGIPLRELGKPERDAVSPLFIQHILSIQQVRITLAEACLAQGIELVEWLDEKILRRQPPARVTLTGEHGERLPVVVIPDAVLQIRRSTMPGTTGKVLRVCLELDRATTLLRPSQWQVRSMRRKYLAYQALLTAEQPAPMWGRPFIVLTVTTSTSRAAHLRAVCEEAGDADRAHCFWFAPLAALSPEAILTAPAWMVAGRGEERHCLLPQT
jgi:hypothetical protein